MTRLLSFCFCISLSLTSYSQPVFEGTATVILKTAKDKQITTEVAAKGELFYIVQKQNGNPKYSGFILNTKKRELITLSDTSKKIALQYHVDSLIRFYVTHELKEGFSPYTLPSFTYSDKTKPAGGYVAETTLQHHTVWVAENQFQVNSIVAFLQLIGSWNEANGSFKNQIFKAEVYYKANKKKSEVTVQAKAAKVDAGVFQIPASYTVKNMAQLMSENQHTPEIISAVKTFTEF